MDKCLKDEMCHALKKQWPGTIFHSTYFLSGFLREVVPSLRSMNSHDVIECLAELPIIEYAGDFHGIEDSPDYYVCKIK